jgi:uncharacterized membrane protein
MRHVVVWLTSWRTRWRLYEYLRNSLWIVPFLCVALALAAGFLLPIVDEHVTGTIGIVYGADAGRALLGAIAGGMITFTGFVFSILLLAVQFGSSQFSPRMLRRFLRDPSTKAALGIFMATFIYALTVLRVVGTGRNNAFVPSNSISVALILLLLSMLMFLRLITRTTQGLRVAAVVAELGRDARRIVDRAYPEPVGGAKDEADHDSFPPGPVRTVTYRGKPGIVQSVDFKSLVDRGSKAEVVIELVPRLGDLVSAGWALFRVHGKRSVIDDEWLRGTVATGDERTMRQDPAFGFRLLADISARALSPGVNDPTTATQALDQIDLLLRQVGGRRLTPGIGRDASGAVRLRYRAPSWEDYLSLAIDETRQYGEGSVQVMRRLRALLDDLRESLPEFRRASVDAELALLESAAGRVFSDRGDQLVAAASDHQGLGATDVPGNLPPRPAPASRRPAG